MDEKANVLLARLDAFLDVREADATDETPIERVLRRPWRTLDHLKSGDEDVRTDMLQIYEDLAEAEERVRRDYTGRYAIELLQNAHDACDDAQGLIGRAWIRVTGTALLVGNQGLPFDAKRIDSLLRLGGSSKERTEEHHTIGYKGIGFSSVFEVTDEPQVISRDAQFCFHRAASKRRVQQKLRLDSRKVPVRRFPFPLHPDDWADDDAAVEDMLARGAVTVVRLPLRSEFNPEKVERDVLESLPPEVLLFMPALDGLTFLGDEALAWTKRSKPKKGLGVIHTLDGPSPRAWLTASSTVPVSKELTQALDDDLWADVSKLGVAIAVPWAKGRPDPVRGAQSLHVYFPTEDDLGRAVLVHGDFYVDSSRRHIEHRGAGGEVSELVAGGAVRLLAKAAEALASHGNDLLKCLAPIDGATASGYGRDVAQLIDEHLKDTRFCRPANDKGARKPGELLRLGTKLDVVDERRLGVLIQPQGDLMRVGDDLDVDDWLTGLGCGAIKSADLATRIEPARAKVAYDKAVEVVALWYDTVSNNYRVKSALVERPLVQDVNGHWRTRDEVVIPDRRTPPLPPRIRPRVYAPPRNRRARAFIEKVLEVPEMSPDHALDLLLGALDEGTFGRNDDEKRAVLDFLFSLRTAYPKVIDAAADRLTAVEVPVRKATGRKASSWRPAGTTYFSKREMADSLAQPIYGSLGEEEFLVIDDTSRTADWVELFSKMGVATQPRDIDIEDHEWSDRWEWLRQPEFADDLKCPDGHPQSGHDIKGHAIDRLAAVVALANPSSLRSLAVYLAHTGRPYGGPAEVACGHSAHRGSRGRKIAGFQEWFLNARPWIPVREPGGGHGVSLIREAWYELPPGVLADFVPAADLPELVSAALGLVSAAKPARPAVEAILEQLADEHPELCDAPAEITDAAEWLLRRLDAMGATSTVQSAPPLPAHVHDTTVWSRSPLVPDLAGANLLGIPCLSRGDWPGLRASYGLALASERVHVAVSYDPPSSTAVPRFNVAAREQLVALLTARGADLRLVARRTGLLKEVVCSALRLELRSSEGSSIIIEPHHHLEESRDRRRRRQATLYLTEHLDPEDFQPLARHLARYLEVDGLSDALTSFLLIGESFLASEGLGSSELIDARQALAKYPRLPEPEDLLTGLAEDEAGDPVTGEEDADLASEPSEVAGDVSGAEDEEDDDLGWSDEWPSEKPTKHRDPSSTGGGSGSTRSRGPAFRGLVSDAAEQEQIDPDSVTFGEPRSGGVRQPKAPRQSPQRDVGQHAPPAPRVSARERDATDQNAMAIVSRFAEVELGAKVNRVDDLNLGWDLELEVDGTTLLVEVKGFAAGSSSFIITRNELRAAESEPNYRVAVVSGVGGRSGVIAFITDFAGSLDPEQLNPMSWAVEEWTRLPHEVRPWKVE